MANKNCIYNCGETCSKECLPKKEKWLEMMDFLAENNEKYNDLEFAERFNLACKEIPANTEVTHEKCNIIIQNRVVKYCDDNNIKIKDYNGPLPFRIYTS